MMGWIRRRTGKRRVNGKPVVYYDINYQVDGRRKSESIPPPRTRRHAEKLLAHRESEVTRGEYREPTKLSFKDFIEIWVEKYACAEVEVSTLASYDGYFRNHLLPVFGNTNLGEITVEQVQAFKSLKLGQGQSPQSVKHYLRLFEADAEPRQGVGLP